MQFLYLNEEFLLKAVPGNKVSYPDKKEIINELNLTEKELKQLKENLSVITEHFNKEVKNLTRLKKEPGGYHLPEDITLPSDLAERLKTEKDSPKFLPANLSGSISVSTLSKDDIIKSSKAGKKLDWLNYMIPDGKVFPYTILPENYLSRYGFPIGLYTKEGQDVNPNSIKHIYYIHPISRKITKGIYFEVSESKGEKGNGGINGIIVPENESIVIINHSKNEVYFINPDVTLQKIYTPIMPKAVA